MEENNFKCNDCGLDFYEPSFRISYDNKNIVYKNKHGKIKCKDCKSEEVVVINSNIPKSLNIGKFNMMSNGDKKKMLKKRANIDYKKNIEGKKDELIKATDKKLINNVMKGE